MALLSAHCGHRRTPQGQRSVIGAMANDPFIGPDIDLALATALERLGSFKAREQAKKATANAVALWILVLSILIIVILFL